MLAEKERDYYLSLVDAYKLSPKVERIVDDYEAGVGLRNRFLWKWVGAVFKYAGVTLSCVDEKLVDEVVDTKILITVLAAVFDDVADRERDWERVERLSQIVFGNYVKEEDRLAEFTLQLWNEIVSSVSKFPMYRYYEKIFLFDVKQMINSMFYSCIVNEKPEMMNFTENSFYTASNMCIYPYIDVDLMASPTFDVRELGRFREMLWHVQQMARIGNWITTWKRELRENDVSSGVFAYSLSSGVVTPEELRRLPENEITAKIEGSDIVNSLIQRWSENYEKVKEMAPEFRSFDGLKFVKGLENLLKFHLASEGYK